MSHNNIDKLSIVATREKIYDKSNCIHHSTEEYYEILQNIRNSEKFTLHQIPDEILYLIAGFADNSLEFYF